MSTTDYAQTAEDHRCMLVLVKQVGCHLKPKSFVRLYERISRVQQQTIQNQKRTVHLRYKRFYSSKDNTWGDFQAHRKVLGLLCVGKCENQNEVAELVKLYESVKSEFKDTIFNSRLILFGLNNDGTPIEGLPRSISEEGEPYVWDHNRDPLTCVDDEQANQDEENSNKVRKESISVDFRVLPANRVNGQGSNEINGSLSPTTDNIPRTGSSSALGSLLPKDANTATIICYPAEENCGDLEEKLQEFVSSLFWVLESKRLDRSHERLDKVPLIIAPFERKDGGGVDTDSRSFKKRCQARLKKHLGDLCLLAGLPGEAILHYQTCLEPLRNANDWLWVAAALEGLCSSSVIVATPALDKSALQRNYSFSTKRGSSADKDVSRLTTSGSSHTLPNGVDLSSDFQGLTGLATEDVTDKYREAVQHYSKFAQAGIVEIEASLKACRVLIKQQKFLPAADFLQNVVYINIPLSEEEKIHRFSTLAQLYGMLGMQRKNAFFKRIAAMQCVAPTTPKPAWVQCYHLLIQALEGYQLPLDFKERPHDHPCGWPCVQLRVLHELIYSARRMGNPSIAVRHLSFLLHTMFEYLPETDKREMSDVLSSYTARVEGSPQVLALDNGIILPPVPFLKFPTVKTFKLLDLPPHLRPVKLKKEKVVEKKYPSPFIYSPLQFGIEAKKDGSKLEFSWVQGDVCEVAIQVINPMPYELKVSNVGLLSDGADFEGYPANLSLPPESGSFGVKIMGTPLKTGTLTVLGYTTVVLGVRSHCRLRDMPWIPETRYEVKVVPALPRMQVTTSLPKAASFSSMADADSAVTSATVCLFAGQSCECQITLNNNGKLPIETVAVTLDSKVDTATLGSVIQWNEENLLTQLPLSAGEQASFTVYLHGLSTFLPCDRLHSAELAAAKKLKSPLLDTDPAGLVVIESLLKLQYSGGPGLGAGYSRQCSVALTVEIQPSLVMKSWDIIPADSADHCHLILDFDNSSSEDIELQYTEDRSLVVESQETCRVAIQIPCCDMRSSSESQVPADWSTADQIQCVPCVCDRPPEEWQALSHPLTETLSQHVANLLHIKYKILSDNTEGQIDLSHLWWTKRQAVLLLKSSILWELKVNGQSHLSGTKTRGRCGETVSVLCTVTNVTETALCDCSVTLECYRSLDTGSRDTDTAPAVVTMGTTCAKHLLISPEGCHSLECSLVFLSPGEYCVDITCQGLYQTDKSKTKCAQTDTTGHLADASTTSETKSCVRCAQIQTWTYIPPIEISIKEAQD